MITTTISFAAQMLLSSYRVVRPLAQLIEYVLPYQTMAKSIKQKVNFNSRHLKQGDPLPVYNGKLRLYIYRHCPYAHRVVLALIAKNIDYEIVNINLTEKPEWFGDESPLGKVPSLKIKEDLSLCESLVIVEYLDETYPQRPLLPKDPVKRAADKILVEIFAMAQALFFRTLKSPESITEDIIKGYIKALDYVQEQLRIRNTTFLDGDEPGYADYMIWPWFERVGPFSIVDERLKIDPKKYELLLQYIQKMRNDPVVSEYLIPDNIILEFLKSYQTGTPRYEILNE